MKVLPSSSWLPACAGMTYRGRWNDELRDKAQPDLEMGDLPALNHCFIKKAVRELDYTGQHFAFPYNLLPITYYPLPITPLHFFPIHFGLTMFSGERMSSSSSFFRYPFSRTISQTVRLVSRASWAISVDRS